MSLMTASTAASHSSLRLSVRPFPPALLNRGIVTYNKHPGIRQGKYVVDVEDCLEYKLEYLISIPFVQAAVELNKISDRTWQLFRSKNSKSKLNWH